MYRKYLISLSFLLILFFVSARKSQANIGCCNFSTSTKMCAQVLNSSITSCPQGVKQCSQFTDSQGALVWNELNRDITGDGAVKDEDKYNPDCYIPIVAPAEVQITDFGKLFGGAVALLLLVAFILAFFFLILGGISWLTSGGDKAAVEAARNKIISAIIGLVIVAAVWALFQLVGAAIGYNILGGFTVPRLF